MQVNLDQIEFYYGPSRKQPRSTLASASANRPPLADVPQPFQRSFFSTETLFIQSALAPTNTPDSFIPLTHEWSSTSITKPQNAFDVAITNFYEGAASQPQRLTENKSLVTTDIPGTNESPLDLTNFSLSLSEPPTFEDFTLPTSSAANEPEQGNALSGNIIDTIDAASPRHSMSPAAASESASTASGSLSLCGDSQPEQVTYVTHEPPCRTDQGRDVCLPTINTPEQTKDPEPTESKATFSSPPFQSNARSSPECSASLTNPSVDRPESESYPSIAVVVPAPPWTRGKVTRATTRVAALTCKKRLRSSRDVDDYQYPEVSIPDATRQRPKKRSRPTAKSLRHSQGGLDPVLCDCSRAIHEVCGRAILTVESSGLKPAYYLTFVPDASPMLTQTPPADTSGKQRPYTSDENALLVRLKEREGMPWAEIAAHFPDRSVSSLQVHYSTKLRHKATTRAERLRSRRVRGTKLDTAQAKASPAKRG